MRLQLATLAWLLAALVCRVTSQPSSPSGPLWGALNPGKATVYTGAELLAALSTNTGDITLANPILLNQSDWQPYVTPIQITNNSTVRIHSADPAVKMILDWGYALELLSIASGSTLILDSIRSDHPGNRTRAVEQLPIEIKGSPVWPTVTGQDGHKVIVTNCDVTLDIYNCNPDFVQVEEERFHKLLNRTDTVTYKGGVSTFFVYIPFPAALFNIVSKQQVGTARYTLANTTSDCYDSSPAKPAAGSGGGAEPWVWAVVGTVVGCALLAVTGAALLYRHRRLRRAAHLAAAAAGGNEEQRMSKSSSAAELPGFYSSGNLSSYDKHDSVHGLASQASGEVHSTFMRTRFGAIDGVQLGELLGRGAFGRVFKSRWKGAIVAVKVIDHRVQPGKTYDLSREPLLSMTVSHPNVVITHKMSVVKVSGGGGEGEHDLGSSGPSSGGSSADPRLSGGSGSQRVPAIGGGSGTVEVVSPHDVLQPGLYETWLICEFCDRGSLLELLPSDRFSPDPSHRDIWVLLCLLDIALGLDYLHSSTIVHGDLKPGNVLLKSARNDRRGFVCKLGDFGLSRMLGQDETHVDTQSYGTASYAAPELLTQGKLTKAADIYSFGIIIWELTSRGSELYPGMTAMQVILQVSQNGMRPEVPASCPPPLAGLMQRCWSHEAAARPTAVQLVEELRVQLVQLLPQRLSGPQLSAATARPTDT